MDIKSAIATYATMPVISGALLASYKYYYGSDLSDSLKDGAVQLGSVILTETIASSLTMGNYSNSPDNLDQIDKFRHALRVLVSGGAYALYQAKVSGSKYDTNNLLRVMKNNFALSASSSLVGGYSESLIKKQL